MLIVSGHCIWCARVFVYCCLNLVVINLSLIELDGYYKVIKIKHVLEIWRKIFRMIYQKDTMWMMMYQDQIALSLQISIIKKIFPDFLLPIMARISVCVAEKAKSNNISRGFDLFSLIWLCCGSCWVGTASAGVWGPLQNLAHMFILHIRVSHCAHQSTRRIVSVEWWCCSNGPKRGYSEVSEKYFRPGLVGFWF